MEKLLKIELKTSILKAFGSAGGGYISQGQSYETDSGRVFVKINHKPQARKMFEGEMASLEAIQKTSTLRVPQPIKVIDLPGEGAMFVMEYLKMKNLSKHTAKLGEQIADLHLHNQKLGEKLKKEGNTVGKGAGRSEHQYLDKFGFHTVTCCGFIQQVNEWQSDWPTFFICHRLQAQMDLIEKAYGDREARELWSQLKVAEDS
ncbi:fructosamine-3-kinase isoform X2 [Gopherus flavomarginatus]|uniref:fructosamine-3-kinase isoform X2 n=1 Tax=Gopherus flavomarginatus TaxID=286002 RepID=UPI0021CBE165|nr:fructosamine-3-kinase isoform X2 [Gopherus flavomarginatus]